MQIGEKDIEEISGSESQLILSITSYLAIIPVNNINIRLSK